VRRCQENSIDAALEAKALAVSKVLFPAVDADGRSCVEIGVATEVEYRGKEEAINAWFRNSWCPSNTIWQREWTPGRNAGPIRLQRLSYGALFSEPPRVNYALQGMLCISLVGKLRGSLWKDWLVSKILPDLRKSFPGVSDEVKFIQDCGSSPDRRRKP